MHIACMLKGVVLCEAYVCCCIGKVGEAILDILVIGDGAGA